MKNNYEGWSTELSWAAHRVLIYRVNCDRPSILVKDVQIHQLRRYLVNVFDLGLQLFYIMWFRAADDRLLRSNLNRLIQG